jgi:hypothetical protein
MKLLVDWAEAANQMEPLKDWAKAANQMKLLVDLAEAANQMEPLGGFGQGCESDGAAAFVEAAAAGGSLSGLECHSK